LAGLELVRFGVPADEAHPLVGPPHQDDGNRRVAGELELELDRMNALRSGARGGHDAEYLRKQLQWQWVHICRNAYPSTLRSSMNRLPFGLRVSSVSTR